MFDFSEDKLPEMFDKDEIRVPNSDTVTSLSKNQTDAICMILEKMNSIEAADGDDKNPSISLYAEKKAISIIKDFGPDNAGSRKVNSFMLLYDSVSNEDISPPIRREELYTTFSNWVNFEITDKLIGIYNELNKDLETINLINSLITIDNSLTDKHYECVSEALELGIPAEYILLMLRTSNGDIYPPKHTYTLLKMFSKGMSGTLAKELNFIV